MSEMQKQLCETVAKVASKIDRDTALELKGIIKGAVLFTSKAGETDGDCENRDALKRGNSAHS